MKYKKTAKNLRVHILFRIFKTLYYKVYLQKNSVQETLLERKQRKKKPNMLSSLSELLIKDSR